MALWGWHDSSDQHNTLVDYAIGESAIAVEALCTVIDAFRSTPIAVVEETKECKQSIVSILLVASPAPSRHGKLAG